MTAFAHNYKLEDLCIDASAPQEEINALLGKTGAIVIKGLLSQDKVDAIRQDLKPHLQALGASGSKDQWDGDFFPSTTKKIPGLATKSPAYVENMILNPTLNGIAKHALERRTRTAFSFARHWSTCKPQINVTGILEVHPGSQAQDLHRDDAIYHDTVISLDKWDPKREKSILALCALSKVLPENGGTNVVPGSHLIGDDKGSPSYEDALQVRAEAGDCIVILCSVFHGGGTNSMQVGEDYSIRTMALCGWAAGYMRQEENQYVALDPEDVKKLSPEVQELLGWNMSLPYLGWVNWGHARAALVDDPKSVPQGDELFWDKDQSDLIAAH